MEQQAVQSSSEGRRKVIVAIDDSEYSEKAFEFFCENILKENDYVCLVHGVEKINLSQISGPSAADRELKKLTSEVESLEGKWKQKLVSKNIDGKFRTDMMGDGPGPVICRIAEEEKAVMVVLGTRGLGKIRRTFLGSVSDYVVHHAHVPVLVCRPSKN